MTVLAIYIAPPSPVVIHHNNTVVLPIVMSSAYRLVRYYIKHALCCVPVVVSDTAIIYAQHTSLQLHAVLAQ